MDLYILWLVPVAYFVHILEESPRFVPWAQKYLGAPETFGQFVIGNVIFMAYVIISTSLAIFYTNEWTLNSRIICCCMDILKLFNSCILHITYRGYILQVL